MPDRCRDLVQHPNKPRPMAAEVTDETSEPSVYVVNAATCP